jgi:hypothetical protein
VGAGPARQGQPLVLDAGKHAPVSERASVSRGAYPFNTVYCIHPWVTVATQWRMPYLTGVSTENAGCSASCLKDDTCLQVWLDHRSALHTATYGLTRALLVTLCGRILGT